MEVNITVLVDNMVYSEKIRAEHGLSMFIETEDVSLLFDTGQSSLFMRNAEVLDADIISADTIVLSHGHYDHTGGIPAFIGKRENIEIIGHEDAFKPKYSTDRDGNVHDIGIPCGRETIESLNTVICSGVTEVAKGIFAVTDIPRTSYFETVPDRFFADRECTVHDSIRDDLSLVIETSEGLVCLLGCAHAGVANILEAVHSEFPARKIRAVMGGTHLINAQGERLAFTLEALKKHDVQWFRPGHCTGVKGISYFMMQSFIQTAPLSAGTVFSV